MTGLKGGYGLEDWLPTVDEFVALCEVAGMAARSPAGVEQVLPNSRYGVVIVHEPSHRTVAMGRVVGDDGSVLHVTDMAVHPDHQGRGSGPESWTRASNTSRRPPPPRAYVTLMADVDGFYERFGFEETRPASKGLYLRTD